jgi:U3 small nucleolar RNA-associated protein 22
MEASAKRRKLEHANSSLRYSNLIDFESRSSARISTTSTFTLQTEELLKEAKIDYGKVLKDVDTQLHRLKGIIDSIPNQGPLPVRENLH